MSNSTNLPKEIMGYPDFPIPEQEKSYIPAADMLDFLDQYAEHFNVKPCIRFQHYVIRVRPVGASGWELIVRDLPNERIETHVFDALLVCNGHYHTPAVPQYAGRDEFGGQQIHSHDYRCAEPFKGEYGSISCCISFCSHTQLICTDETVLVIGAGPSGMDLAHEISKLAHRVTLSHHHADDPQTQFADNVDLRPDVRRLTHDGAEFADGTRQTYSVIFYCTGESVWMGHMARVR